MPGMVVHAFNSSPWEAEAGGRTCQKQTNKQTNRGWRDGLAVKSIGSLAEDWSLISSTHSGANNHM